jgi:hypothetical protein
MMNHSHLDNDDDGGDNDDDDDYMTATIKIRLC